MLRPPVTATLADFVVDARFEDLPTAVRREAARTLVNWVGGCVGGASHEALGTIWRAVGPFSGPAEATVLGSARRTDPLTAALLNGASGAVLDFDDTHLRTVIHPASPIAPAVLALSQHMPVTGAAFLHALVIGIEVACKIGNGISPDHYRHGWHITGTCGVIGAAAACSKLLGLDGQRTRWALSAAATQAAGLREMFGGMARILHAGRAAQNGLSAALFAREGLVSSDAGIEAETGFAKVLSRRHDWAEMTDGLGERWETLENTYKPFATGIVAHPAIDGCIRLRRAHAERLVVRPAAARVHQRLVRLRLALADPGAERPMRAPYLLARRLRAYPQDVVVAALRRGSGLGVGGGSLRAVGGCGRCGRSAPAQACGGYQRA